MMAANSSVDAAENEPSKVMFMYILMFTQAQMSEYKHHV